MKNPASKSTMLEDCLEAKTCSNSPFSPWEEDFLDSIQDQLESGKKLSQKQGDALIRIWDKI